VGALEGVVYLYAEYCPGPWYWGWWLYAAPIVEDKPDWEHSVWLKYEWRVNAIRTQIMGLEASYQNQAAYKTATAFVTRYPSGMLCQVEGDGRRWTKLESDQIGDYGRMVREMQLIDMRKALEKEAG